MNNNSDKQFGNDIWIQYHRQNLEVCKQLVKEGNWVPATVILELMEYNLKDF